MFLEMNHTKVVQLDRESCIELENCLEKFVE